MSETRRKGRDLLSYMEASNLTEYGSVIKGAVVREVMGIDVPEVASQQTYQQAALLELGAVDYVRNVLLGDGKYLGQVDGNYRVFLPSENADQIKRYMQHADNKLKRGLKLWRNTPKSDQYESDNLGARLLLKREGLKGREV